jgi:hypothetical protein
MRIKYLLISMALLPIIITPGFTQNKEKSFIRVHKIARKSQSEYSDWQKSPLNPMVNSEPNWNVNKRPPQKAKTTVLEERVWESPANQKIVSSENSEIFILY